MCLRLGGLSVATTRSLPVLCARTEVPLERVVESIRPTGADAGEQAHATLVAVQDASEVPGGLLRGDDVICAPRIAVLPWLWLIHATLETRSRYSRPPTVDWATGSVRVEGSRQALSNRIERVEPEIRRRVIGFRDRCSVREYVEGVADVLQDYWPEWPNA